MTDSNLPQPAPGPDYASLTLSGLRSISQDRDRETPRKSPVGLSQIGKCPRQLWYKMQGTPEEEVGPETYGIWALGNSVEDLVVEGLEQALTSQDAQLHFTGEDQLEFYLNGVPGHSDGVVFEPVQPLPYYLKYREYVQAIQAETDQIRAGSYNPTPAGAPFRKLVLEIKSMSDYGFQSLIKQGLEQSYPDYFMQIQTYIRALCMDGGIFLAWNKGGGGKKKDGTQKPVMYMERVQPQTWMVDQHMARIVPLINGDQTPERPFIKAGGFQCQYCPFNSHCWAEDK